MRALVPSIFTSSKAPSAPELTIQTLEDRTVPALSANFTNNILTITGTDAAETIRVNDAGGRIRVDGVSTTWSSSSVNRIVVDAKGGNDRVQFTSTVRKPSTIFGGAGNDTIIAGSGDDVIYGGHGNDFIQGAAGRDEAYGGLGANVVQVGSERNQISQRGLPNRTATPDQISVQINTLINRERSRRGLRLLSVNPKLTAAAQIHAKNMADRALDIGGRQAHQHVLFGTTAPTLLDRLDTVGYEWTRASENIAFGYNTAQEVVSAWMNSPAHRRNILDPNLRELGTAVSRNRLGAMFFAQEFGSRV
jgi:uncharacterized protein YkwD